MVKNLWPSRESLVEGLKEDLIIHKNNKKFYKDMDMSEHALIEEGHIRQIESMIKKLGGKINETS